MTKQERLELNALSKEVFGSTSTWYDITTKGRDLPSLDDKGIAIPGKFIRTRMNLLEVKAFMEQVKSTTLKVRKDGLIESFVPQIPEVENAKQGGPKLLNEEEIATLFKEHEELLKDLSELEKFEESIKEKTDSE